jgi:hypothetical protein
VSGHLSKAFFCRSQPSFQLLQLLRSRRYGLFPTELSAPPRAVRLARLRSLLFNRFGEILYRRGQTKHGVEIGRKVLSDRAVGESAP